MGKQEPKLIIIYESESSFEKDFVDFIDEVLNFNEKDD